MRWQTGRRSENVEDQRGRRPQVAAGAGAGVIVIALIAYFLGVDPRALLNLGVGPGQAGPGGNAAGQGEQVQLSEKDVELGEFVSVVLADTEDTWNEIFRKAGKTYREPKLVLFTGSVQSACGFAEAAMGPFYCGGDEKVYIDLSFYDDLKERHGAPGDFAQAYVIAHEVGHHVQKLLGISDKMHAQRERIGEAEYNKLSVKLELQADFFAGLWAHYAQKVRNIVEEGDIEEALNAASSIGDDRLQRQARGYVVPDSFTHGTSEQRVRWFRKGYETGDMSQGDTFSDGRL
jgi:predicted metalloprotease